MAYIVYEAPDEYNDEEYYSIAWDEEDLEDYYEDMPYVTIHESSEIGDLYSLSQEELKNYYHSLADLSQEERGRLYREATGYNP